MNISYVYLAHVSEWPGAPLIGFGAALMTVAKTVLYWLQEYFCNFCAIGHNTLSDLLLLWILPNGSVILFCKHCFHGARFPYLNLCRLWIVFPSFIVYKLGKDLVSSLNFADAQAKKISSGKKQ